MTCFLCEEIERAEHGEHPMAVARLAHGYVWLNTTQYDAGATFYVARRCVPELHDLPDGERLAHLGEMSAVAAAVHRSSGAVKMNDELLDALVGAGVAVDRALV